MTFVNDGIALIADDDLFYFEDTFDTILDTFRTHKEIDLAFFKTKTPDGESEYKKYPLVEKSYTRWKGYAPSSIEMAFRVEFTLLRSVEILPLISSFCWVSCVDTL
jgi:hypothetical protein